MTAPHLTRHDVEDPRGLVLMLHGGEADGTTRSTTAAPSWRRSRLMMAQLSGRSEPRRGSTSGCCATASAAGTHGDRRTRRRSRTPGGRWTRCAASSGDLPVVLLGHSMGARTAVAVADDPNVPGVVALAPWFPPGEPVEPLRRQAPGGRARPRGPDHLRPGDDRRSCAAPSRSPRRRSSSTWATSATTCSAASRPGTASRSAARWRRSTPPVSASTPDSRPPLDAPDCTDVLPADSACGITGRVLCGCSPMVCMKRNGFVSSDLQERP